MTANNFSFNSYKSTNTYYYTSRYTYTTIKNNSYKTLDHYRGVFRFNFTFGAAVEAYGESIIKVERQLLCSAGESLCSCCYNMK